MRSFTDPPGLKNSALAYTGVRIPCVTRFSRTSGVQPMVSRILPYGLAWDGIRVRLRRAVRDGARRVQALRDRVPLRGRRVTPRRADRSHRRRGTGRAGARGVPAPRRDGPAPLPVTEPHRLEGAPGDGETPAPARGRVRR